MSTFAFGFIGIVTLTIFVIGYVLVKNAQSNVENTKPETFIDPEEYPYSSLAGAHFCCPNPKKRRYKH